MNLEEKILKLCSPGKIIKTKTRLRFFSSVDTVSPTQNRDPGMYIIKSSEIFTNPKRVCIALNDDWILEFYLSAFASKCGAEPRINEYIEILGN